MAEAQVKFPWRRRKFKKRSKRKFKKNQQETKKKVNVKGNVLLKIVAEQVRALTMWSNEHMDEGMWGRGENKQQKEEKRNMMEEKEGGKVRQRD